MTEVFTSRERRHRDDGFATTWVVLVVPVVIVFALISVSLWNGITVRRQLVEMAESAARAGANGIDVDRFAADGDLVLDPERSQLLASETLSLQANRDLIGDVRIDVERDRIVVELSGTAPLLLFGSRPVEVDAAAAPRRGAPPP
ncbi:MAG: hypothetical protein AAFP84_07355 [Actinomycetota bacterium]